MTENIGGFVTDMPYFIKIENEQIPIAGTWKYKIGAITKAQNPTTFFQYKPTGVYNGMIYPYVIIVLGNTVVSRRIQY